MHHAKVSRKAVDAIFILHKIINLLSMMTSAGLVMRCSATMGSSRTTRPSPWQTSRQTCMRCLTMFGMESTLPRERAN